MKRHNILTILILGILVLFGACQSPDDLKPSVAQLGINSITAQFVNNDGTFYGEFKGLAVEGSNEIVVKIPYFYPETSDNKVTDDMLKRMRISANLDDNVTISPTLLFLDLTQENPFTVTTQLGEQVKYNIRGQIVKSTECVIQEFKIPSLGLTGIINDNTSEIALITTENIGTVMAEVRSSAHATISPDPTAVALDYDKDQKLVVTAYDGVTKREYSVKKSIPNKLEFGLRSGSAKIMFAKKLNADLGIKTLNMTGGLAVSGDYLVLNTRGENSVYINAKTGEKVGEIDLGNIKGSVTNFYHTSDEAGNILVANLTPNAGNIFKLSKLKSVKDTPADFIAWDTGGSALGRKVSIAGNIDANAIITAPIYVGAGVSKKFARWQVVNGALLSQTPTLVDVDANIKGWTTNGDLVYTSGSDITSDYFIASYSENKFTWVNGKTNIVSDMLDPINANFIQNAVDYAEFNKAKYATLNWINSFTWGSADFVWLLDVSSNGNFNGNLEAKTSKAVVWQTEGNKWGPNSLQEPANANGTGDVLIKVSDDGYFMYLYFMFTNGYVVGVQFDCIDM